MISGRAFEKTSYLLDTSVGMVFWDARLSMGQDLSSTLAGVVQLVPHIPKYDAVRLPWRNLLPKLCNKSMQAYEMFANSVSDLV
jgi:hypothetical protein